MGLIDRLMQAVGLDEWRLRKERRLLLRMCLNDAEAVERIVSGEMSRNAGITKLDAYRKAIRRLQHDNR